MKSMLRMHRAYYQSGTMRDPRSRIAALKKFGEVLKRREPDLMQALYADLGKSPEEAYMTEIGIVYGELRNAIRHTRGWSRSRRRLPSMAQLPGHGRVYRDPYGVVLILAPWNYPVQLTLVPLIAAVAAGNCAVVRPSSSAPKTADILSIVIRESFAEGHVSAVLGPASVASQLTALPFDKIFFTGSPAVGREVMQAASANLVPITLELGGKSPAIVAADADIPLAAKRIVFGKCINAGQTCVAPDYVLVNRQVHDNFLQCLKKEIARQYGADPLKSPDLPVIVNRRHFDRLVGLMEDGRTICGGTWDARARKIAPTVLVDVPEYAPVMQEEIFGPILPVLSFRTMEGALSFVRSRPHPLAFYLFSGDKDAAGRVMRDMTYGGGCVNDCVIHLASHRLPFGGIGESGMGTYHGRYGFECFTRPKGTFVASTRFDLPVRYAPWKGKLRLLQRIMR